jgi:hypothetical protein
MMETAALITALAAGAFGALAYGYRGQRDQEREQVVWLRKELADVRKPPPPTPQGEAQRGTQPRSNVPALVDGGRP